MWLSHRRYGSILFVKEVTALVKKNLPGWARKTLGSLIEVIMPRSDEFHPDLKDYILNYVDAYVGYFPKHLKLAFPMGLLLLERGTLLFMGRLTGFSKLDLAERDRYVRGWINSRWQMRRELIRGVKGLVMVAFYSHPVVMEHIGYDIKGHIAQAIARKY